MNTRRLNTTLPKSGDLWLSCPPYSLIARIIDVDCRVVPHVVSYELHDESESALLGINHGVLDSGWWQAFQPMVRRYG